MNSYIYIVEWFSMEPYSDFGGPAKAFTSREAAEDFIKENNKTYGEGYVKYDGDIGDEIPCDENDIDAFYEYGWAYSSRATPVVLEDK